MLLFVKQEKMERKDQSEPRPVLNNLIKYSSQILTSAIIQACVRDCF